MLRNRRVHDVERYSRGINLNVITADPISRVDTVMATLPTTVTVTVTVTKK
jgi:hypothetical protein